MCVCVGGGGWPGGGVIEVGSGDRDVVIEAAGDAPALNPLEGNSTVQVSVCVCVRRGMRIEEETYLHLIPLRGNSTVLVSVCDFENFRSHKQEVYGLC